MSFLNKILDRSRRVIYQYWGSRFGHGCRVSKEEWNEQYRHGKWNVLKESHEQEHYETLTSLCMRWGWEESRVLDVGCGEGVLLNYFHNKGFSFLDYVGIDISQEAIQHALSRFPSTSFLAADVEQYQPDSIFDMIIFNESLYYMKRPINVMKKYEKSLKSDGIFITSMCDYPGHSVIWKVIDSQYVCLERMFVINKNKQQWNMAAFKKSVV